MTESKPAAKAGSSTAKTRKSPSKSGTSTSSSSRSSSQVAKLKEQLAYYESLDSVIRENLERSNALLRQAEMARDASIRGAVAGNPELVETLEALLEESRAARERAASLEARIAATLEGMGISQPGRGEIQSEIPTPARTERPTVAPVVDDSLAAEADEMLATTATLRAADIAADRAAEASWDADADHGTVVLVHGVEAMPIALKLKAFFEQFPGVNAVEPREFAEGILRLQVHGPRVLTANDVKGWQGQATVLQSRPDLLEFRIGA